MPCETVEVLGPRVSGEPEIVEFNVSTRTNEVIVEYTVDNKANVDAVPTIETTIDGSRIDRTTLDLNTLQQDSVTVRANFDLQEGETQRPRVCSNIVDKGL